MTGIFVLSDPDQNSDDFVNVISTYQSFQRPIVKFLLQFSLESCQTLEYILLQFFLTIENEQVLQEVRQVHDEVQLHQILDPTDEKDADLQVQGLQFRLEDAHEFSKVEVLSVFVGIGEDAAEGVVQELAGLSDDVLPIVDAADNSFEDDVEEPNAAVL